MAQAKVLETLAATEQMSVITQGFLEEQQNANRVLEHQNAELVRTIGEIQTKLDKVEARLEVVTKELKEVRAQLASMTKRAITAEEHSEDIG